MGLVTTGATNLTDFAASNRVRSKNIQDKGAVVTSKKQKTAARKNIKKAAAAAKKKRTIAHLPKSARTALGKQASKVAKRK